MLYYKLEYDDKFAWLSPDKIVIATNRGTIMFNSQAEQLDKGLMNERIIIALSNIVRYCKGSILLPTNEHNNSVYYSIHVYQSNSKTTIGAISISYEYDKHNNYVAYEITYGSSCIILCYNDVGMLTDFSIMQNGHTLSDYMVETGYTKTPNRNITFNKEFIVLTEFLNAFHPKMIKALTKEFKKDSKK